MPLMREGVRFLRRNWLLSLSAVAVLAAGMAASAMAIALFVLFSEPIAPGTKPGNFATIAEETHGGPLRPISWMSFVQLQRALGANGLAVSAYSAPTSVPLADEHQQYAHVSAVSGGFFERLVDRFSAGSAQRSGEGRCSSQEPLVISAALAKKLFGGPSKAIDKILHLQGATFRVSGVAPHSFRGLFDSQADAWIPAQCVGRIFLNTGGESPAMAASAIGLPASSELWKDYPVFYAIAASRAGTNTNSLLRESDAVLRSANLPTSPMSVNAGLTADPERDRRMRKWSSLGTFLATCLTLASSLNFTGLLLARVPKQMAEVCLKKAIGAGSGRLFMELCAGPLLVVLLAFLSAAALFALSWVALARCWGTLANVFSLSSNRLAEILGWDLSIAVVIVLIIAVMPVLRVLKESGAPRMSYGATGARRTTFMLQAVVAAQVGFCIAVLVVAAMVINASHQILRTDLGFQPQHRQVFAISQLEGQQVSLSYRNDGPFPLVNAANQVRERLAAAVGVRSVALALRAPLDSSDMSLNIRAAGSAATSKCCLQRRQ